MPPLIPPHPAAISTSAVVIVGATRVSGPQPSKTLATPGASPRSPLCTSTSADVRIRREINVQP